MAIKLIELIQNPKNDLFSKLTYLKRKPKDEVTQFCIRLFHLSVTRKTEDCLVLDNFLEEEGGRISSREGKLFSFSDISLSHFLGLPYNRIKTIAPNSDRIR